MQANTHQENGLFDMLDHFIKKKHFYWLQFFLSFVYFTSGFCLSPNNAPKLFAYSFVIFYWTGYNWCISNNNYCFTFSFAPNFFSVFCSARFRLWPRRDEIEPDGIAAGFTQSRRSCPTCKSNFHGGSVSSPVKSCINLMQCQNKGTFQTRRDAKT